LCRLPAEEAGRGDYQLIYFGKKQKVHKFNKVPISNNFTNFMNFKTLKLYKLNRAPCWDRTSDLVLKSPPAGGSTTELNYIHFAFVRRAGIEPATLCLKARQPAGLPLSLTIYTLLLCAVLGSNQRPCA